MTSSKHVVFFHPDLGIGGAERLIIDAAVSLQELGHKVVIYTSHCDPTHCFDEARDGTLDVRVRGNLLPATFLGRFKILLTILRHTHLLLSIYSSGELEKLAPQVFFPDQLSAGIPLLRYLYPSVPILFYCHFPDLLLVQRREAWVRRIWRLPFDALEGWSMRGADRIIVNSKFTKGVVEGVWPALGKQNVDKSSRRELGIVYPCVDTKSEPSDEEDAVLWPDKKLILSINRFERKKGIDLAIRAFAKLEATTRVSAKLIVAGGYDLRVQENVAYHTELVQLAESLGLKSATARNVITAMDTPGGIEVLFLLSVPSSFKATLLKSASLLVYTPINEHFGIVPLEAMLAKTPVLASNTGGPLETVLDGKTGWLRNADDVDSWTDVMATVLARLDTQKLAKIGDAGRSRVLNEFSKSNMGNRLDEEIQQVVKQARVKTLELRVILTWILMAFGLVLSALVLMATSWQTYPSYLLLVCFSVFLSAEIRSLLQQK